jgi:zinc/manganese transport system ATP-binding protein
MNNICLEFRNLTLGYQGHAAVHHLSGDVQRGSLTAVVGANSLDLVGGLSGRVFPDTEILFRHIKHRKSDE